jgi:hypothetical protein
MTIAPWLTKAAHMTLLRADYDDAARCVRCACELLEREASEKSS